MKIKVNGSEFLFFNDITITLLLDSVASAFSFVGRFNPENPIHKELFRPLGYPTVQIFDNNEKLLLTGTVLNHTVTSNSEPNLVALSGYSLGGILEDCNIPLSAYPLESLQRSLKEITERLLNLFNLRLIIAPNVAQQANTIYKKTAAEPTESIAAYISKLAAQRNIVLSHDTKGNLVFFRPNASASPRYFFNQENTVNMGWSINGQNLHSTVEVLRQPSDDNKGVSLADKASNPLVKVNRPAVSVLTSGTETDTKLAADNKLASELANMILNVEVEKQLEILPGDIVEVQNKEIFLRNRTRFMANGVTIKETDTGTTVALSLVLPETYTGGVPKNIFA